MHTKISEQLERAALQCLGFICVNQDERKEFVSLYSIARRGKKKKKSQPNQPREAPAQWEKDENKNPILDENGERIYGAATTPERRQALESIRSGYERVENEQSPFDIGLDVDQLRWTNNALTFLRLINDPLCEQLGEEESTDCRCDFGAASGIRR